MGGMVFKGEKIVIPMQLREEMLKRIHAGHMGIEKSKQRSRDILFWPGMSKQIACMVEQCSNCLERRMSNAKEPLISHPIPNRPWQIVGTDLLTWNSDHYIVVVDYYSRYFDLEKLKSTTAAAVILKLKKVFAAHGIPEKVISDNGPQFSSKEFENFARTWDFVHVTSSPHYPQSNGLSEKAVQIAKSLMDKAKADKKDPYISLLEYRNTPVDGFRSPAQLLMSRRLRSILATTSQQLQPETVSGNDVHARREQKQQYQAKYYNRSAKPLTPLRAGDHVRIQELGKWKPAVVIKPADTFRSYHLTCRLTLRVKSAL